MAQQERQDELDQNSNYQHLLEQNKALVSYLDKAMLKEICLYKNFTQLNDTLKILCILVATEPWDSKAVQKWEDPEHMSSTCKKLLQSTKLPLSKRLAQFKSDVIPSEKLDYIERLIEERQFSPDAVATQSVAMSNLAKWELGIMRQRRLQI